jgi:hypothetical protein
VPAWGGPEEDAAPDTGTVSPIGNSVVTPNKAVKARLRPPRRAVQNSARPKLLCNHDPPTHDWRKTSEEKQ